MADETFNKPGVLIAFHSSNLVINGQRTSAKKLNDRFAQDGSYRVNMQEVKELVLKGRQEAGSCSYIAGHQRHKGRLLAHYLAATDVKFCRKSGWSGKEKGVSNDAVDDMLQDCCYLCAARGNLNRLRCNGFDEVFEALPTRVYAIVSGSAEFIPLVKMLLDSSFPVEVYSWSCGLSHQYETCPQLRAYAEVGGLKIQTLDEHYLDIGFHEKIFKEARDKLEDKKFVVLVFSDLSQNQAVIMEAICSIRESKEFEGLPLQSFTEEGTLHLVMPRSLGDWTFNEDDIDAVLKKAEEKAGSCVTSLFLFKNQAQSASLGRPSLTNAHNQPLDNTHVTRRRCCFREFCRSPDCLRTDKEHTAAELHLFSLNNNESPFLPGMDYHINELCKKHDKTPLKNQHCKLRHQDQARLCYSCCKYFGNSPLDDQHLTNCSIRRPIMKPGKLTKRYFQERTGRCPANVHKDSYCECVFQV
jgi:hypothetical protein